MAPPKLHNFPRKPATSGVRNWNSICRVWRAPSRRWSSKRCMETPKGICVFSCGASRGYRRRVSKMQTTISIVVNGENRAAKPGATVVDLLADLGLNSGRLAIERNLEILPRQKWIENKVEDGDRYEIGQFVGGRERA